MALQITEITQCFYQACVKWHDNEAERDQAVPEQRDPIDVPSSSPQFRRLYEEEYCRDSHNGQSAPELLMPPLARARHHPWVCDYIPKSDTDVSPAPSPSDQVQQTPLRTVYAPLRHRGRHPTTSRLASRLPRILSKIRLKHIPGLTQSIDDPGKPEIESIILNDRWGPFAKYHLDQIKEEHEKFEDEQVPLKKGRRHCGLRGGAGSVSKYLSSGSSGKVSSLCC